VTTQTATWNTNITRALELDGERRMHYQGAGRFVADSASSNQQYVVTLTTVERQPVTTCTCPAGEFGKRCHHQAAALLMAGVLDAPQPEPAPVVDRSIGAILDGSFRRNMGAA
jgi:hypothetical protein